MNPKKATKSPKPEIHRQAAEKIRRGLHPESLVSRCDICDKGLHDILTQYGRWMLHDMCYEQFKHLVSIRRKAIDYSQFQQYATQPDKSIINSYLIATKGRVCYDTWER